MSIETELKEMLKDSVKKAFDVDLELSSIVIETPKNKDHGDFSSNVAMQLTRTLHTKRNRQQVDGSFRPFPSQCCQSGNCWSRFFKLYFVKGSFYSGY